MANQKIFFYQNEKMVATQPASNFVYKNSRRTVFGHNWTLFEPARECLPKVEHIGAR